ncbi:MAG: methionine gamma-lyase family protein [Oscillospiraceae bacterium]|nr:methionine gamma-lyase family protein [Oscillospiraceae bacterium]
MPNITELFTQADQILAPLFAQFDAISTANTERVLIAFAKHRVSDAMFGGTTGYGYDDAGRTALESIYADVFGAETALVRTQFVSGTHAISCALFGAIKPSETLISAYGAPYDTLQGVIAGNVGSFDTFNIEYRQVEPLADGAVDFKALGAAIDGVSGAVLIQRSRGYSARKALTIDEIGAICSFVKSRNPAINIVVDNCYGEFTDTREPTHVGADIAVGSLIKNPGGGLAPCGGYICGRADLVEAAAARMTAPGIAGHCGATLGQNRLLFQGFFLAPHTVNQALKISAVAAEVLSFLGYDTSPTRDEQRSDIITRIAFGTAEPLLAFCRNIQYGSPVDSFVTPEPWPMPGYGCDVIMAAGTFVQGASIELSCDAPIREPFAAYLQGGLTYESGKICLMRAVEKLCES